MIFVHFFLALITAGFWLIVMTFINYHRARKLERKVDDLITMTRDRQIAKEMLHTVKETIKKASSILSISQSLPFCIVVLHSVRL